MTFWFHRVAAEVMCKGKVSMCCWVGAGLNKCATLPLRANFRLPDTLASTLVLVFYDQARHPSHCSCGETTTPIIFGRGKIFTDWAAILGEHEFQ